MQDADHDDICNGGVARMSIKTGDIRRLQRVVFFFLRHLSGMKRQ